MGVSVGVGGKLVVVVGRITVAVNGSGVNMGGTAVDEGGKVASGRAISIGRICCVDADWQFKIAQRM